MAPSVPKSSGKLANKETKKFKKEKVFHPQSRKAGQLERAQLRKNKLAGASSKRARNLNAKADRYAFFFHALPPDVSSMTLPEIHDIVKTVWLARHDELLEAEQVQRRPGKPPSTRELALREMKLQDEELYRSGLTLPDLTDSTTVTLFRAWETRSHDPAYLHLLRTIRISSANPDSFVVEHIGAQAADEHKQQKAREEKAKVDAANRAASRQEAARAAKDVSKMDVD
ncbi:translation machinery-associated protein 16 [Ceratobasidium sp. AG-Ba]|nr:translation machinery-associated protein 16 [Ceratobasidium sp. AG-Ba]